MIQSSKTIIYVHQGILDEQLDIFSPTILLTDYGLISFWHQHQPSLITTIMHEWKKSRCHCIRCVSSIWVSELVINWRPTGIPQWNYAKWIISVNIHLYYIIQIIALYNCIVEYNNCTVENILCINLPV